MVANVGVVQPDYVMVDSADTHGGSHVLHDDLDRKDTESPISHTGRAPAHSGTAEEVRGSDSSSSLPAREGGSAVGTERRSSSLAESSSSASWRKGSLEDSEGSESDRAAARRGRTRKKVPVSVELLQPALQALTVLSNVRPCWFVNGLSKF